MSEEEYLHSNKFSIPECFQIPMLPEPIVPKPIPLPSSVYPEIPVPPSVHSVRPKIDSDRKIIKKRVTAGMKLTRNQIDLFAEESSTILSRISAFSVNTVRLSEVTAGDVGVFVVFYM